MNNQGLPQPNYTQIPNFIIDKVMKKLSGAELKIFMLILRYTLGFHRRHAEISLNHFVEQCSIDKKWVRKTCEKFEKMGWIKITRGGPTQKNIYEICIENDQSSFDEVVDNHPLVGECHLGDCNPQGRGLSHPQVGDSDPHNKEREKEISKEIEKKNYTKRKDDADASHSLASARSNMDSEKKKSFGNDNLVKLTYTEYQKLIDTFGENLANELISDLNDYIGSKGVKYKSHYHTIRQWAKRREKQNKTHSHGFQSRAMTDKDGKSLTDPKLLERF